MTNTSFYGYNNLFNQSPRHGQLDGFQNLIFQTIMEGTASHLTIWLHWRRICTSQINSKYALTHGLCGMQAACVLKLDSYRRVLFKSITLNDVPPTLQHVPLISSYLNFNLDLHLFRYSKTICISFSTYFGTSKENLGEIEFSIV